METKLRTPLCNRDSRSLLGGDMKGFVSALILIMILVVAWFWKTAERSKATDFGFGFMEIVYLLSLIAIWS